MNTRISFIGEHEAAKYLSSCTDVMPRLLLSYQVSDAGNSFPDDEVNVEEFIAIKSYKAKGKRLSNREIESYQWLEPIEPEVPEVPETSEDFGKDPFEEFESPKDPEGVAESGKIEDSSETPDDGTPDGTSSEGPTGNGTSGNGSPGIQMELF